MDEAESVKVELSAGRPLSPMQRSLWASQLNDPDAPVQNMALLSHFRGEIDPHRLSEAFTHVVAAHDVLRSTIDPSGSNASTHSNPRPSAIVELASDEVEPWARDRARTPLDMSVVGYDSVIIVHLDPGGERNGLVSWYLNLHHVITDATSSATVFSATGDAYHGRLPTPSSYYRWARGLATADPSDRARERASAHWRDRPPAAGIGHLYRPVERPTPAASRIELDLGTDLASTIDECLGGEYRMLSTDLAWTTLLMTATSLYLHRVSGATSFSLGLPVHNRTDDETRAVVGPTVEVFPVDIGIEPGDTHRTVHKRVGRAILATLRHAIIGTAPKGDHQAVVNVIPRATQQSFGPPNVAVPVSTIWLDTGAIDAGHLLRVQMTSYVDTDGTGGGAPGVDEPGDHFQFALDINHGGADEAHRRRAAGHFKAVLGALVDHPDRPIGSGPICGPDEMVELAAWETTPDWPDPTGLLLDRLGPALLANDGPAVIDDEREFTGPRLWAWIRSTAGWLQFRGVEPASRVGIELPRSIESVVAIMATLVAGASFVPLDPAQPESRRKRLADRADCRFVLSSVSEISALDPSGDADSLPRFHSNSHSDSGLDAVFTPVGRRADDEAYLLFTSGSTGEPKGVPITHGGLAGYLRFAEAVYPVEADAGVKGRVPPVAPLFSALTFDLTITTLFVPLLAGGRLIVIEEDGPQALSAIAARPEINWAKATPSHLELLIRLLPQHHRLSTLIVGGEAFGTRLARDLLAFNPDMAIYNEYGPTEAVVGCMIHRVEPEFLAASKDVPIGRPAPGVTLVVVDEHLQRVPSGAPGELCISHDGVTDGYLTEGASSSADSDGAPSPFVEIDGRRFYRSGDLVRLMDPDRLVYLGRIDTQVKIGGIRLEPIEVSEAIDRHPAVRSSVVRLWSPTGGEPTGHCVRCGLPDNIPGVGFDSDGICDTCHAYRRVAPMATGWFKTGDDLRARLEAAGARRTGPYDCLHLLSGGKDSTYALYKLVEFGFHPYVLTLDNGFISEGAKENVRRSVADLGLDHEFASTEAMNDIFRDSLQRHSNVCHGCYKTIYTLATNRAVELGIPVIVTGLSRGQLFETRLIPQQFSTDRFDPDAIDRAVIEARKVYHRIDDGPNRLLDTEIFADDDLFDRIEYLDFYRYVDVELAEMLSYLGSQAPWVRPSDTGRSTNCLINAAGIHTHQTEQGYHNYAVPYAWDVRLGHKTREEAIEELDDKLDEGEVAELLAAVGYEPRPTRVLTAWIEPERSEDGEPTRLPGPAELRAFLTDRLPAHAIPSAFVTIDALPLTTNGKLDEGALPPPERIHRTGGAGTMSLQVSPTTATERSVIEVWERILQMEPVGVEDDFFELGGDSLGALEMIVALGDRTGIDLAEDLAFVHTTVRNLAGAVDAVTTETGGPETGKGKAKTGRAETGGPETGSETGDGPGAVADVGGRTGGRTASRGPMADFATGAGTPPTPSPGELAILFDQTSRPDDIMYNVARLYRIDGEVDGPAFEAALRKAAARHQPLRWSHGPKRVELDPTDAVAVQIVPDPVAPDELAAVVEPVQTQPFDLERGPLLRCLVQPVDDGTTAVALAIHHASGDAESFGILWRQIDEDLQGRSPIDPEVDYAGLTRWQRQTEHEDRRFWLDRATTARPTGLAVHIDARRGAEPDGFLTRSASFGPDHLAVGSGVARAGLVTAATAATVRRYADGSGIDLGLIASTRNHPSAEHLFGYLLNTLPLRLECGVEVTLQSLVTEATGAVGGALAHRAYPLARILSDRRYGGAAVPRTDILVAVDDLPTTELGGRRTEQQVLWNGTAVADLTFFVEVRETGIDLSLEYRGRSVPAEVAARMLDDFDRALRLMGGGAGAHPPLDAAATIADLWRPASEEIRAVDPGIGTDPAPVPPTRHSLLVGRPLTDTTPVLDRVTAHLDDPVRASGSVVVCGDRELSRAELSARADAVTAGLMARRVRPGDRVLVAVPRGPELVAAILGVLRVGAAYVPVDVTHPASRIELITSRSGARVGIVGSEVDVAIERRLVLDGDLIDGIPWDVADLALHRHRPSADDAAYVIFTSGSTGRPRGVAVTHGQLTASTNARDDRYPSAPTRFLVPSSPAFDSSIVGLFWTLATGGTVVLPTEAQVHDVAGLHELAATGRLSHTLMVPSLYRAILDRAEAGRSTDPGTGFEGWVEHVIVAGEACSPSLVERHFQLFGDRELTNEYGPTETTVWSNAHRCRPGDDPVPIGPAIPGSWVAVVDHEGLVRPVGVDGELWIGGAGVTAGYLDDPVTTEAKYGLLADDGPTAPPGGPLDHRYFRTGDRSVVLSGPDVGVDPTVFFLGRVDNQLNVGGARVEPEEIERILTDDPTVDAAVVTATDLRTLPELLETVPDEVVADARARAASTPDPSRALELELRSQGRADVRLVAHLEVPGRPVDLDRIRRRITDSLPAPMRPSLYATHRALPRTPNGKLDREAAAELPIGSEPEPDPSGSGRRGPRVAQDPDRTGDPAVVDSLTELFRTALRDPSFRPDDSFFDRGGHSLLAMELLMAVEDRFGTRLAASDLHDAPSPAQLAGRMGDRRGVASRTRRSFLVPIQPVGDRTPIFAVHVLGVDCEFFRPLSARLGPEQPFFGLGQPSADLDTEGPSDVADICAVYTAEIDRVRPDGPVSLAAISLGGVVAYELAQQLRAAGRQVQLLALFDALGPGIADLPIPRRAKVDFHLDQFRRHGWNHGAERLRFQALKAQRLAEKARIGVQERLDIRSSHQLDIRRFIEDNIRSQTSYVHQPYDGPMLVIKAGDDPVNPRWFDMGLGWSDYALNGLETATAPGRHLSMMAEPNVEHIAVAMRRADAKFAAEGRLNTSTVADEAVESALVAGLRAGRLPTVVTGLRSKPLSDEVVELLDRADDVMGALADATLADGEAAAEALVEAGLEPHLLPVPSRIQHSSATIAVTGDVHTAHSVMTGLGFDCEELSTAAARRAAVAGAGGIDYIRRATTTTRLRLQWSETAIGGGGRTGALVRRSVPGRTDFRSVSGLPEWAWPAYWAVKPLRVGRDRLPGTGATPGRDLGIFLGTPIALIPELLELAGPRPGELVVDIGSGDGRVPIEAARRFGCRGLGIERDPALVELARTNVAEAGVEDLVDIRLGEGLEAPVEEAGVVFAFLPPHAVDAVLAGLLARLRVDGRLITHEQLGIDWSVAPATSRLVVSDPDRGAEGGITVANLWFGTGP